MFLPAVNFFCEKRLFQLAGGFPEIRAAEDVLFGLALGRLEKMCFIPQARVHHVFREDRGAYYENQEMLGNTTSPTAATPRRPGTRGGISPAAFALLPGMEGRQDSRRIVSAGRRASAPPGTLSLALAGLMHWGMGFLKGCLEGPGAAARRPAAQVSLCGSASTT